MKVSELMIGDWVLQALYKDAEIPNKGHGWKEVRVTCLPFDEDWAIEPIPLTEKILSANKIHYLLPNNGETFDKEWVIPNGAFHIRQDGHEFWVFEDQVSIRYVHQLQHALRLCGLNDIVDNFKVTE